MFTKYSSIPFIPFILSCVSLVAAHGYINEVVINGETVKGNAIGETSVDTPIRSVSSQDPMKGADNKELSCGPGSKPAKSMADINPGDDIEFSWVDLNGGPWFHQVGPMLTYMGLCGKDGSKDCADVDSATVKWFKVEEAGIKDDGQTWYQDDLTKGKTAKVTIPDDLASGNYLIRHEIIALHNGVSPEGAEFYAGCVQLTVGGDGTEHPAENELLEFPGAYQDDDAGILVPDIFNPGAGEKYKFPGGPLVKLVAGLDTSGDDSSSESESSSTPDSNTPSSTASSADTEPTKTPTNTHTSTGSCKSKKRSVGSSKRGSYHPKRHSRVMRDLVSSHHS